MTLPEWQKRFSTVEDCHTFLINQRWPDGFVCPICGHREAWVVHRQDRQGIDLYECKQCRRQTSVTAGTVFHRSKVPLPVWFLAIYLVAIDKRGVAALTLARQLGVAYHTAWLMHHKIQQAMAERNGRYKLGGIIELDDAYFGGVSHGPGKRGRGTDQDPALVGVSLNAEGHPVYGFLEKVSDLTNETIFGVLQQRVEPESTWRTDGADGYAAAAPKLRAQLEVTPSTSPKAPEVFHWVNVLISNAKAFWDGTYHGRGRARRQLYFAEYMYRYNRRHFGDRLPERLIMACLGAHPHPYGT